MVADGFINRKAHPDSDKLTSDFSEGCCPFLTLQSTKMTNLVILFQRSHQKGFAWSLWFQAVLRSALAKANRDQSLVVENMGTARHCGGFCLTYIMA